MTMHLQREIEGLKKMLLSLSAYVEESVQKAVRALADRDSALAQRVIDDDTIIDKMEVDVEEECLKVLALHQPVAIDLRFIISVLKINSHLERIGDLSVNIAERALYLNEVDPIPGPFDFLGMATKAQSMLRRSLDALITMDSRLAREVCADDDEVDQINRKMHKKVKEEIKKDLDRFDCYIHLLGISRHIERIADQATNIAEEVVYMTEGEIVRHRFEDFRAE
ncbi:MAG TPA: phosphate signaling complex protein PhoU [Firmicutes bacterium]|nr:phosphate signaling complex protein PhoU [Bacillota bacterium]